MLSGGEPGPVGFDIDSGRKDLRAMLAEGEARGIELPLVARTLACFEEVAAKGLGAKDASSGTGRKSSGSRAASRPAGDPAT